MEDSTVHFAAKEFGITQVNSIELLSDGLIHQTFKISSNDKTIILQQINSSVFKNPQHVVENYIVIHNHLTKKGFIIPSPIKSEYGEWLWQDNLNNFWRAQQFIKNSFTQSIVDKEKAYLIAKCFAEFSTNLSDLEIDSIHEILANFHNLKFRYDQFNQALSNASQERMESSKDLIEEIQNNKSLVSFYEGIIHDASFKKRIMHHDSKLSNVLFDKTQQTPICPIDLDTTMPGYYFSDVGDMIRSMAATTNESNTQWGSIGINESIYQSIIDGYLSGVGKEFSEQERKHIHHSGLLMIYMQAMRFLTDYLSNDAYYKIGYSYQNLDRSKNQLILLKKLKNFLLNQFNYTS